MASSATTTTTSTVPVPLLAPQEKAKYVERFETLFKQIYPNLKYESIEDPQVRRAINAIPKPPEARLVQTVTQAIFKPPESRTEEEQQAFAKKEALDAKLSVQSVRMGHYELRALYDHIHATSADIKPPSPEELLKQDTVRRTLDPEKVKSKLEKEQKKCQQALGTYRAERSTEPHPLKEKFVRNNNLLIGKDVNFKDVSSSIQGDRSYNEDRTVSKVIKFTMNGEPKEALFSAVYDGHGGEGVSQLLSEKLDSFLAEELTKQFGDTEDHDTAIFNALKLSFAKLNAEIKDPTVGSCAIGTLIMKHNDQTEVWCANVGDSRAVLLFPNETIALSYDHTPTDSIKSIARRGGDSI